MSQPRPIQRSDTRLEETYKLLNSILDHKLTRIQKENLKRAKPLLVEIARSSQS